MFETILDWVNGNEAKLYDLKSRMFDRWVDLGDALSKKEARRDAEVAVRLFARTIDREQAKYDKEPFTEEDVQTGIKEFLKEFEEYREEALENRVKQTTRVATPEELTMTEGEIEHAKKYDKIARKIGIERLQSVIPASPEAIRKALLRGDKHLVSIPSYKWDDAAAKIKGHYDHDVFMALKHVATWYYA